MHRLFSGLLTLLLIASASVHAQPKKNPHIVDADPLSPEEQLKKFHLSPGFVIQLVAAEPQVKKPINIAFDARGRLWVTGSEEYPFPAPTNRPAKDTVKILDDFDANGRARKTTTFADNVNIPIGILPVHGGALVYSIPNIYFMHDSNDDGISEKRDILYSAFGFNDTHGMTGEFMRGFDGWIYCCHGFSNTSNVKGEKTPTLSMTSGNTYRIKIDGSRIEPFTRGQVNPFGLCFDPLGNLFSTDCHTRPLYQLLKGAHYPSFGRPHDGLGFGPEMVTHDHGSTGIAGIAMSADDHWPEAFRDNLFVGNVITNRVNRDRLERHGSTYKGIALPDFIKCDDPWFRPVDIKLGPDGALYVADFYNRIIGHYEVPLSHPLRDREKGRIWKVVPIDEQGKLKLRTVLNVPKASAEQLVAALDSGNLTARLNATHELVHRNDPSIVPLLINASSAGSPTQKVHALWALARMGKLEPAQLSKRARDESPLVRTHVMRIIADRPTWTDDERSLALSATTDSDAFVVRAAAGALGDHPHPTQIQALLSARTAASAKDTHLIHVLRMSLRDHFRDPISAERIVTSDWSDGQESLLADVCPGAANLAAAKFLLRKIEKRPTDLSRKEFVHTIVRHGTANDREQVLVRGRRCFADDVAAQAVLLRTLQQALQERGEKAGPAEIAWASEIAGRLLNETNPGKIQEGIDLAQTLKLPSTLDRLLALVTNKDTQPLQRRNAISTLVAIDPAKTQEPLAELLLSEKESLAIREQVVHALAGTNQPKAHETLVSALAKAPARLQTTIALAMSGSLQGGTKLLDAVAAGKASPRLLQDRAVVLRLQQVKVASLDNRLAALTKGMPPADLRLNEVLAKRRMAYEANKGDAKQGALVFQKNCAACHQIANQGAKFGPQLDGIGIRGIDRILEDILDPNRNVDQAFRATILELDNGQVLTGLLTREEGQVLVMIDGQGKEVRVPKSSVQERRVGPLSPMPANFLDQIPEEDFNRLLAFLLAQRVKN